jgi:membrane-bound lytic murein transglycosylase B
MFLVNGLLWAQDSKSTFDDYLLELKQEAQTKGFDDTLLDKAFASIEFRQKAVQSDKSQPEFKLTLARYLKTRVPDWKVKQAVAAYKENQDILEEIGEKYAVQPRFIVALWANESNFGKIQGRYSVLSALSTLAFEGRRETFFKKQFFAALQVVDEGHIKIEDFVGSWAGALGQCQFIPTSFLTYGVDYNDDGKKDIWQTKADVFASIANYLQSEGWDDDLTWGRQVILPDTIQLEQSGLGTSKKKSLQQWADLGITRLNGHSLPVRDIKANLIMADQGQGNSYLVYGNFDTLMRWNRSIYFGVGIGYLADAIKRELNNES